MQIYKVLKKQSLGAGCPQQNKGIFSNWRNSSRVSSESHRWRGRLFHRCSPATV